MPQPPAAPKTSPDTLYGLLEKSKKQIALALPRHMTPERMIRVAVTAVSRTPELQKCSPLSILGCVIQAAELGLELAGPLGQAYMVPYWNKHTNQKEAQFQIGYRGLVKLAFNSGLVSYFNAHVVCAGDFFEYEYGTAQRLRHRPAMKDRGEVEAVYSVLKLRDGGADFEVMSVEEIESHRKRYSKQREGSAFNPWETAWDEMAKKTPTRRLAKRAPLSVELQTAAALDEYAEAGVPQGLTLALPPPAADAPRGRTEEITDKINGHGNGAAAEEPEGAAEGQAEPPPAKQPPAGTKESLERDSFAHETRLRLQDATNLGEVEAVKVDVLRQRDWLGGELYDALAGEIYARQAALTPPAAPKGPLARAFEAGGGKKRDTGF